MATTTGPTKHVAACVPTDPDGLPTLDGVGLRLLLCAGTYALGSGLILLVLGSSESLQTRLWLLAFVTALPAGLILGAHAERLLGRASVAPAAAPWALAGGTLALALSLYALKTGSPDAVHDLWIALAGVVAVVAPSVSARLLPPDEARLAAPRIALGLACLTTVVLFIPDAALGSRRLAPSLLLGGVGWGAVVVAHTHQLSARRRHLLDAVAAVALAALVFHLPSTQTLHDFAVVYNDNFFLGPVNDIAHGRAMLVGTWSQYGVGEMDALRAVFSVVPLGYGGLSLVIATATAAEYLLVFALLRMVVRSQLLAVLAVFIAACSDVFAQLQTYLVFPSTTALRFGLPLLLVTVVVAGARSRRIRPAAQAAQYLLLAIAAVWSFETAIYTATAYAAIVLADALAADCGAVRRVTRGAARGAVAVATGVSAYSLLTMLLAGTPHWDPYAEYISLYARGLGALPMQWFSTGPVLGAVIFTSAAGTLILAMRRAQVAAATLAALAGLSGTAIATYTYYTGRAHPNNVLHLMLPVCALATIWTGLLLERRPSPARIIGVGGALLTGAMLFVFALPAVEAKWQDTALAQGDPLNDGYGLALRTSLRRLWSQPAMDPRAVSGQRLLDAYLPPHAPALVLAEPDLTTEILIRAGRSNLLPIADPLEDDLNTSLVARALVAAQHVPAGTLMLMTPPPGPPAGRTTIPGSQIDPTAEQTADLAVLQMRFRFQSVRSTPDGLQLVRLVTRPGS